MTRSLGCQFGGRRSHAHPPKTSSHQDRAELTTECPPGGAKTQLKASRAGSFRCGEDGEARRLLRPERGSSEDGAEELLLPEGVLRGRQRHDEGVLAYVRVAEGHQVRGGLGDLRG